MTLEKDFFRELGTVPKLPSDLFKKTEDKIRHRSMFVKSMFALAATVIIAVGTTGVLITHNGADQAFSPEVAAELQDVRSYLAGEDLDRTNDSYALYVVDAEE
jgi:hypothetical protein